MGSDGPFSGPDSGTPSHVLRVAMMLLPRRTAALNGRAGGAHSKRRRVLCVHGGSIAHHHQLLHTLVSAIDARPDWWRFPEESGVRGFLGDGEVFFVGDQPSTSAWPVADRGRRIFYDGLKAANLGNSHLTDLVKRRGKSSTLKSGLPVDFARHIAFFREELTLLQPRRVVALGRLCERLLREHVPEVVPRLTYVYHFAYAARAGVLRDYTERLDHAARAESPIRGAVRRTVSATPENFNTTDRLIEVVATHPQGVQLLRWTLRRDNRAHHHGVVTWKGGAVYLKLAWRPSKGMAAEPVGLYRLDLRTLLASAYVRYEPDGVVGNRVRVRVVMRADGTFALQVRASASSTRFLDTHAVGPWLAEMDSQLGMGGRPHRQKNNSQRRASGGSFGPCWWAGTPLMEARDRHQP